MRRKSDCCGDNFPWPGLRLACVKVLQLYCKVFERNDFQLLAGKSCKECKCARDLHVVVTEQNAKARIGLACPEDEEKTREYAWTPPGLDEKQEFIRGRNEIALDIGIVQFTTSKTSCSGCDKPITAKQAAILASRIPQSFWHPQCFRCDDCRDLLVDLAYCEQHNKPYCIRHYSDRMKPRCNACDEPHRPRKKIKVIKTLSKTIRKLPNLSEPRYDVSSIDMRFY